MRFEGKHEGITYAIALKPRPRGDGEKLLGRLKIEIYRKYPSGEKRGHVWKISFFDKSVKVEKYEYSDLSWHKAEVSIKAEWIAEWYMEDVEKAIRELGVKGAAEHFLRHLKIILDHPLVIPIIR
jgi:hypothetical protein